MSQCFVLVSALSLIHLLSFCFLDDQCQLALFLLKDCGISWYSKSSFTPKVLLAKHFYIISILCRYFSFWEKRTIKLASSTSTIMLPWSLTGGWQPNMFLLVNVSNLFFQTMVINISCITCMTLMWSGWHLWSFVHEAIFITRLMVLMNDQIFQMFCLAIKKNNLLWSWVYDLM